jgi:hypothetical protein
MSEQLPVTADKPAWAHLYATDLGDEGGKLPGPVPAGTIPVFARPGMVTNSSGGAAIIEMMTPELCIVRYANGVADALTWSCVDLAIVRPDPAYLTTLGKAPPAVLPAVEPSGPPQPYVNVSGLPFEIFEATHVSFDGIEDVAGYLVARVDDDEDVPWLLIAFSFTNTDEDAGSGANSAKGKALERARRIAEDFDTLDYSFGSWASLLHCGKPDSEQAVPDFLWGLRYRPAGEERQPGDTFGFKGYCKWHLAELTRRRDALAAERSA